MKTTRLTRRAFLRASAAGTLSALLAGCAPLPSLAPAPTSGPRRVLRINMPLNRGDVGAAADPGCSGAYHSYFINSLMFSALVALDEKLRPVPDVAASWQANADGVWRFNLRPDVTWTDGVPVTAHDFAWAVKRKTWRPTSTAAASTGSWWTSRARGRSIPARKRTLPQSASAPWTISRWKWRWKTPRPTSSTW